MFTLKKKRNFFVLHIIIRRISTVITYFILKDTILKPNFISLINFFVTFLIALSFINHKFLLGSALIFLWVLFDNIDGELARLKNMKSTLGAALENHNSNLMYAICIPSISFGLYKINKINIDILTLSFVSCITFSIFRHFIAEFPLKRFKKKNFIFYLVASQFKNMDEVRRKFKFGSIVYYIWRNIFSQVGLSELIILYGSILFYLGDHNFLVNVVKFYSVGYLIFDIIIFLGLIFYINKN